MRTSGWTAEAVVFAMANFRRAASLGLGLAIVKKAIDDHGGSISVSSKEGSGTTFTIILPATEKGVSMKVGG